MHGTENNMFFFSSPFTSLYNAAISAFGGMWPAFSRLLCKFQCYSIWEKNTSRSWVATRVCDSWTWSCHLWHRRGSQRGGTWAGIRHISFKKYLLVRKLYISKQCKQNKLFRGADLSHRHQIHRANPWSRRPSPGGFETCTKNGSSQETSSTQAHLHWMRRSIY